MPALDRWLRASPDSAEAHFVKSQVYFELARFDETSQALDRAQWLGYPERPIYRLRALLLVRLRRYIEAEPILLLPADESQEPDPEADEALTLVFLETYRLELAVKVIERWIRDAPPYVARCPHDVRGHIGLAKIALEDGDEASAARHVERALGIDPANAEVLKIRAPIDSRHGDHVAALLQLNRGGRGGPE